MIELSSCEWVIPVLWAVADEASGDPKFRDAGRVRRGRGLRNRRNVGHPGNGHPRNRKWMGEVAESAFLHKAMELGLMVSKPWGDSGRYDFVVDTGAGLARVQVKSTECLCEERYSVAAHGSDPKVGYGPEEIDFLVAWVVPEDAWYVIPVEAFAGRTHLWLYPRGKHAGQYEKYRDAWELLGVREPVS